MTYGSDRTLVLNNTAGITDTGTTLLLLASGMLNAATLYATDCSRYFSSDAIATYQNLTGAVLDEDVGLLRLTPAQFANLQSLFFTIGDVSKPVPALLFRGLTMTSCRRPTSSQPMLRSGREQ